MCVCVCHRSALDTESGDKARLESEVQSTQQELAATREDKYTTEVRVLYVCVHGTHTYADMHT